MSRLGSSFISQTKHKGAQLIIQAFYDIGFDNFRRHIQQPAIIPRENIEQLRLQLPKSFAPIPSDY